MTIQLFGKAISAKLLSISLLGTTLGGGLITGSVLAYNNNAQAQSNSELTSMAQKLDESNSKLKEIEERLAKVETGYATTGSLQQVQGEIGAVKVKMDTVMEKLPSSVSQAVNNAIANNTSTATGVSQPVGLTDGDVLKAAKNKVVVIKPNTYQLNFDMWGTNPGIKYGFVFKSGDKWYGQKTSPTSGLKWPGADGASQYMDVLTTQQVIDYLNFLSTI